MGRPAARDLDEHVCPMTGPAPHEGGAVVVTRYPNVIVGGRQAAVINDVALCKVGWPNFILLGSFSVFVNGLPAARKYDMTTHAGMILQGEPTVLIGMDTTAELLRLAIMRIAISEYGKTADGRKTIEVLEKKMAEGKLSAEKLDPGESGAYATTDQDASNRRGRWDKAGDIAVDGDEIDDVDATAAALVHEAKHDEIVKGKHVGEVEAHEEADRFYQEQKRHGYEDGTKDQTRRAIDGDRLPQLLKDRNYEEKDL